MQELPGGSIVGRGVVGVLVTVAVIAVVAYCIQGVWQAAEVSRLQRECRECQSQLDAMRRDDMRPTHGVDTGERIPPQNLPLE